MSLCTALKEKDAEEEGARHTDADPEPHYGLPRSLPNEFESSSLEQQATKPTTK